MTTQIAQAAKDMKGDRLVAFLLAFPYVEPAQQQQSAAERYWDKAEPDPGYVPNSTSEVQHLADTGAISREDFHAFLTGYGDKDQGDGYGPDDEDE